jgi:phage baseplate assembly protein W
MTSRSDFLTRNSATPELRSDLDAAFVLNPITSSISRVVNEAAVSQAIRLTLLTVDGEWPFEPDNGTAINRTLFDPSDEVQRGILEDTIANAVNNRCSAYAALVGVQAKPRADSRYVDVLVAYRMVGGSAVSVVTVVLRRAR